MRKILFFFLIASIILVTGCMHPAETTEKPIGKGYLNLCITDPERADYWQRTDEVLWNTPENPHAVENRAIVGDIPACQNTSVTIWGFQQEGGGWYLVTTRTKDGRTHSGWLAAGHLKQISNETGTEWSTNYNAIVGSWYQTGRGNGAKIWYEFNPDGTFTFNYDMMGNGDNTRNKGSWTYLGNKTYEMVSSISHEPNTHGNENITLIQEGKSFQSGTEYSSPAAETRAILFAKK